MHWPFVPGGSHLLYEVTITCLGIQGGRIDSSLRKEEVEIFRVVLGVEDVAIHIGRGRAQVHGVNLILQRQRVQLHSVSRWFANQATLDRVAEAPWWRIERKW